MAIPPATPSTALFAQTLSPEGKTYLQFHGHRFAYLTNEVIRLTQFNDHPATPLKLLDIGPHFQTTLLRQALGPEAIINSLGWEIGPPIVPEGIVNQHFNFDLNDTPYADQWVEGPQHYLLS